MAGTWGKFWRATNFNPLAAGKTPRVCVSPSKPLIGHEMFRGTVNPTTGRLEWALQDRDVTSEDSDLSPELARSQYGDMLHDHHRNQLYRLALERAVDRMRSSGREAHVLDIGTGTGLLAMMAARAGASRVTACEVLRPMVKIARQVIAENGYSDIITVVPKRSTEMEAGHMAGGQRANILVTEVFDTELIGEGALVTFTHAHQHLLERNCVVIPSSATVFVQLMHSEFLWRAHKLDPKKSPVELNVPPSWRKCPGPPSLWDLHVEEIKVPEQLKLLSQPTEIVKFPFHDPELSSDHSTPPVVVQASESGLCHGMVVWWSADMEGSELSMDPWNYQQWRDHWLQAVHVLPEPITITKGDEVSVACNHDDYSLWFTVTKERLPSSFAVERPICTCGSHIAWSRSRISMLNDTQRSSTYLRALTTALADKATVLCISDASLLPLLIARARLPSLKQIFTLESSSHSSRVTRELLESNHLTDSVRVLEKACQDLALEDLGGTPVEAVVGEPYFASSLLPWHNLHFWYACGALRYAGVLAPDCTFLPTRAAVKAIAVHFDNLYTLRAPVGVVEGFDLSAFDRTVGKISTSEEGTEPEPHPLWEYPCYARSRICELMNFDLTSPIPENTTLRGTGVLPLDATSCHGDRPCQGVVLWMDYELAEDITVSTGLVKYPSDPGQKLEWDPSFKQAVHFLSPILVGGNATVERLKYSVEFHTANGSLELEFGRG